MSQALEDFFVSIGFKIDKASQQQAVDTNKAVQRQITADAEAAGQTRMSREEFRQKLSATGSNDLAKVKIASEVTAAAEIVKTVTQGAEKQDKVSKDQADRHAKRVKEQSDKAQKADTEGAKKSDERRADSLKRAEAALLHFSGISAAIGAVTSLTVGGIYAGMQRVAAGLEQLNYAGARSGSTPTAFSSFAYGIAQLGGSLEGAQGSLQSFGDRLRINPQGYEEVLRHLGVTTRDATGHLRDSADLATDVLQALGKLPNFESRNYAEQLGIDDQTRQSGADPRLPGIIAQRRADQARIGLDRNEAAKDATAFEQSRRHLEAALDDVATKVNEILTVKLRPALDDLAGWVVNHGAAINKVAQQVADAVGSIATSFAESGVFQASVRSIAGGLQTFAKFVASDDFSRDVKAFVHGISALAKGVVQALKWLGILPDSAQAAEVTGAAGGGFAGGEHASLGDMYERGRHGVPDSTTAKAYQTAKRWGLHGTQSKGNWWTPERQAHAYEKLRAGGLSDYGAKGLISRWMNVESPNGPGSVNPSSGARGIAQWLGTRGYDVPPDFDGQLDKIIHEFHTTERDAFRVLSTATNASEGATGASMTERAEGYNPVTGEDNYTGTTAQGVPRVVTVAPAPAAPAAPAIAAGSPASPVMNGKPKLPPHAVSWGQDSKGNPVPIDAQGNALKMDGSLTTLGSPLGITPSVQTSIDNSRNRGDTTINAPQTWNIQGNDVKTNLAAAQLAAGRGTPDWIRNLQGAVA